jgi:hypothetical protein
VPRCDQTPQISLLATHSKLFQNIILEKDRYWAETNHLVPAEQSGFRPEDCLLHTRVLSICQEVRNNMSANIPTLGVYVDYQRAYDKIWHMGFVVKLSRMRMPWILLKLIISWLSNHRAYVIFRENKSTFFYTLVGLPQGSNLSPYLFIVYRCDIVACVGAHSTQFFTDNLNVLIFPPIFRGIQSISKYLEDEGTIVCNKIAK